MTADYVAYVPFRLGAFSTWSSSGSYTTFWCNSNVSHIQSGENNGGRGNLKVINVYNKEPPAAIVINGVVRNIIGILDLEIQDSGIWSARVQIQSEDDASLWIWIPVVFNQPITTLNVDGKNKNIIECEDFRISGNGTWSARVRFYADGERFIPVIFGQPISTIHLDGVTVDIFDCQELTVKDNGCWAVVVQTFLRDRDGDWIALPVVLNQSIMTINVNGEDKNILDCEELQINNDGYWSARVLIYSTDYIRIPVVCNKPIAALQFYGEVRDIIDCTELQVSENGDWSAIVQLDADDDRFIPIILGQPVVTVQVNNRMRNIIDCRGLDVKKNGDWSAVVQLDTDDGRFVPVILGQPMVSIQLDNETRDIVDCRDLDVEDDGHWSAIVELNSVDGAPSIRIPLIRSQYITEVQLNDKIRKIVDCLYFEVSDNDSWSAIIKLDTQCSYWVNYSNSWHTLIGIYATKPLLSPKPGKGRA